MLADPHMLTGVRMKRKRKSLVALVDLRMSTQMMTEQSPMTLRRRLSAYVNTERWRDSHFHLGFCEWDI
jgi:hypothetical protein